MLEINEILDTLESDALKSNLYDLSKEYIKEIKFFPASTKTHHWWPGGYTTHIKEVANLCLNEYDKLKEMTGEGIDRDSLITVSFCHALFKLDMYELIPSEKATEAQKRYAKSLKIDFDSEISKDHLSAKIDSTLNPSKPYKRVWFRRKFSEHAFDDVSKTVSIMSRFGIYPTDEQIHSLTYKDGGFSNHYKANNWAFKMSKESVILHSSNLISVYWFGQNCPEQFK